MTPTTPAPSRSFPTTRTVPLSRLGVLLLFLAAAAAGARGGEPPGPDDPAVRAELERFQGIWTLESMEVDGKKVPDDQIRGWLLVIEGDQYNPGSGQLSIEYSFRINPARNPKGIDLIPHEGSNKDRLLRGVYTLKNDRLTICRVRFPEYERPAGFVTRPDSGLVTSVWKRRKP